MKPFDLQKALAGDPVITRAGDSVTQITRFEGVSRRENIYGVYDGRVGCWYEDGSYFDDTDKEHPNDLFMAPKVRHGWVVVVPNVDGHPSVWQSKIWTDYKACEERWPDHPKVRIEFEWEAA